MSLNIENNKSGPASPLVHSSNEVQGPNRNSASTAFASLLNMSGPPGLDPHPTDGLEGKGHDKTAGQVAQRARRSLSHLPSIPEDQPLPSERPKPRVGNRLCARCLIN